MKKTTMILTAMASLTMLTALLIGGEAAENQAENLFPPGEWKAGAGNFPEFWNADKDWMKGNANVMTEEADGKKVTFLRVSKAPTSMQAEQPLSDEIEKVTFSTRVRLKDYKQGDKGWDNCNILVSFLDADGEALNNTWKDGLKFRKDQNWKDETKTFAVPKNTKRIRVSINHKASSGDFDIGNIKIVAE